MGEKYGRQREGEGLACSIVGSVTQVDHHCTQRQVCQLCTASSCSIHTHFRSGSFRGSSACPAGLARRAVVSMQRRPSSPRSRQRRSALGHQWFFRSGMAFQRSPPHMAGMCPVRSKVMYADRQWWLVSLCGASLTVSDSAHPSQSTFGVLSRERERLSVVRPSIPASVHSPARELPSECAPSMPIRWLSFPALKLVRTSDAVVASATSCQHQKQEGPRQLPCNAQLHCVPALSRTLAYWATSCLVTSICSSVSRTMLLGRVKTLFGSSSS